VMVQLKREDQITKVIVGKKMIKLKGETCNSMSMNWTMDRGTNLAMMLK
jgi:hypothetical protein